MEDFGSSTIKNGVAIVTIDLAFAEMANTGTDYHVFLTPNGDSKGLYVAARTSTSFEVHESGGGASSLSFDYRIVAKRRGYEAQRLVDVTERFEAETAAITRRIMALRNTRVPAIKPPTVPTFPARCPHRNCLSLIQRLRRLGPSNTAEPDVSRAGRSKIGLAPGQRGSRSARATFPISQGGPTTPLTFKFMLAGQLEVPG